MHAGGSLYVLAEPKRRLGPLHAGCASPALLTLLMAYAWKGEQSLFCHVL